MTPKATTLFARLVAFIETYVHVPTPDYSFAGALWTAATHLWPDFDAFPYLVITSSTKQSGKTRYSELLSFTCANPMSFAGVTPASLFHSIKELQPTIFIDEAESQGGEAADLMRTVLNVGYRKGQTVPRVKNNVVINYPVYCPKAFILIGDVRDTLRDRSIVITMRRSDQPLKRFIWAEAEAAGNELRDELHELLTMHKADVLDAYFNHEGLDFLPDRDEEIWLPLFAVCAVLAPDRLEDLKRVAVDIATEKTQEKRTITREELRRAEDEASDKQYGTRLLLDLRAVLDGKKYLWTADALDALKALPTAPWRKYKADGLNAELMGHLLKTFVSAKSIRAGGRGSAVRRGYTRADVDAAIKKHNIK